MTAPVNTTCTPWIDESDCRLDDFRVQVLRATDHADYPLADEVRSNVLVYSAATVARTDRRALQSELIRALADGPGVVLFEGVFPSDVVDRASDAYFAIIAAQRAAGVAAGDHFGTPGVNDRIWNAAQKLALHTPEVFAAYHANDALAVVCQAWLGPRYQLTSQVNIVNPGDMQQVPHRDYHLGFVLADHLAQYPAHLHRTSPVVTSQGAVAHRQPRPNESGRHGARGTGRRPDSARPRQRIARPCRTENPMTTLGVIGLGRIGAFHTETLSGLDTIDGLVVIDERPDIVATAAAKYGAKPADSVQALLASGVDGVVVSAATPAHAELTLAAVERGLPTFCEKPIASTAAESARVADVIARSGVPVQIGYQRRFDAAFAAAKRAVDDGALGALHTVRSTTMDPAPPPMDYIAGSGGIFRDCAVHDFDVLRWITGQQPVDVYATGSVQGDPCFAEYGDVDTAAVVVRFEQGTLGVVSAARYNARGYDCRLEVHGFHDTVVAGWDQGVPVRNVDPGNEFPAGPAHHFFMDRFTDAFRAELSAFVNVVNGDAAPACTVADAVEVAWLAEAAAESLQRGIPVRLEEVRSR